LSYDVIAMEIADSVSEVRKSQALLSLELHWNIGRAISQLLSEDFKLGKLYNLLSFRCVGNTPSKRTLLLDVLMYGFHNDLQELLDTGNSYTTIKTVIEGKIHGLQDEAVWESLV